MVFNGPKEMGDYLKERYPKSSGKRIEYFGLSSKLGAIGIFEGEDQVEGMIAFQDKDRKNKLVLLDNFYAEMASFNFIEGFYELEDAIREFEELDGIESDPFYSDLD